MITEKKEKLSGHRTGVPCIPAGLSSKVTRRPSPRSSLNEQRPPKSTTVEMDEDLPGGETWYGLSLLTGKRKPEIPQQVPVSSDSSHL